ncbi:hypothetical protein PMAYCL1PPCAC_16807, partial [Pristionchus mayeri]
CRTCFTQQVIVRKGANLPSAIFRPSIISSIWKDGPPGWADAFHGHGAIIGAMYTGALPCLPISSENPQTILDCVPVDVVANMMIICAWQRMIERNETIPVYHCCTSDLNPFNLQKFVDMAQKYAMEYPAERFLAPPSFNIRGFRCIESLRHKMRARCLGPALDKLTEALGHKPFWTELYCKVASAYEMLLPFTRYYHFESTNMLKLIDSMDEEDKKTFDFDVRKIDWYGYSSNGILGLKTFLLRDDVVDVRSIRKAKIKLFFISLIATR